MTDLEKAKTSTDSNDLIFLAGSDDKKVRATARANVKLPMDFFNLLIELEAGTRKKFTSKEIFMLRKSGPFVQRQLDALQSSNTQKPPQSPKDTSSTAKGHSNPGKSQPADLWQTLKKQAGPRIEPFLKFANAHQDNTMLKVMVPHKEHGQKLLEAFDELTQLIQKVYGPQSFQLITEGTIRTHRLEEKASSSRPPEKKPSPSASPPSGPAPEQLKVDIEFEDEGLTAEELAKLDEEDTMYRMVLKIPNYRKPADIEFFAARVQLGLEHRWEVREALALNPRIKNETVLLLAKDEDWTVRQAVSTHPRLMPSMLGSLAEDRQSATTRANVALNPRTPVKVLSQLARDEDWEVRLAVAKNIATLPEDLALLLSDPSAQVREYAVAHPYTPAEKVRVMGQDTSVHVMRVLHLRRMVLDEQALEEALKLRRTSVRLVMAGHKDTPTDVLGRLLQDKNPLVQFLAALHPRASEALEGNNGFPKRIEELLMARSEVTSANQLAYTRHHGNFYFALALSENPKSPPDTLKHLSLHLHPEIRRRLIKNPSTPGEALLEVARDPEWRTAVQEHQNCTGDYLMQLMDMELQDATSENTSLDALERLVHSKFLNVRLQLARHPRLDESLLLKLSEDAALEVQGALLERTDLTPQVLLHLAHSQHPEIRRHLALDDRSTETVLLQLARDTDHNVVLKLLTRSRLPLGVVVELAKNPQQSRTIVQQVLYRPEVNEEVLLHLCNHAEAGVRQQVIEDYRVTEKVLEKLSEDPDETVLRQVIQHPLVPSEVLLRITREKPKLWYLVVRHEKTPPEALLLMADDVVYRLCAWPRRQAQFSRKARSLLVLWMVRRFDAQESLYRQIRKHPNCNPVVRQLLERVVD